MVQVIEFTDSGHLSAIRTMRNMNDAKTVVRVVLLFTALLCTTGIAGDDVPDLSQLGSRSELDTLIASSGDAAIKKGAR